MSETQPSSLNPRYIVDLGRFGIIARPEASRFFASWSNGACQFGYYDRYPYYADTCRYWCFEHPAYARYTSYKSIREHWRASVTDIRAYQREEQIERYTRGQLAHSRGINVDRGRRKRFVSTVIMSQSLPQYNWIDRIETFGVLALSLSLLLSHERYIRSGWANPAERYTISAVREFS